MCIKLCSLRGIPMRKRLSTLIVILVLDLVASQETLAAELDGWPALRHDSGHTGFNSAVGSFRPPLTYLDAITLRDTTLDPVPVFNLVTGPERIYARGQGVIWGVDKNETATQWRNDECVTDPDGFCFFSYMAYSFDRLVMVRQNFFFDPLDFGYDLVVLDASTGLEDWSMPLGENVPEIALSGNTILLLTEESSVGKLTKITLSGSQVFKTNADTSGFPGSRAVVAAGLFIYVNDDMVHAYSINDGQPAWTYTPTFHDDFQDYDLVATADAVIVSQDERVIKLDIADGSLLWEEDIKPDVCNGATSQNAAVTDGATILVTAVCDEEVVALDYANGTEKWRKNIGLQTSGAVAIGGNTFYVASVTSPFFNIYAFDPDTGMELEKIELEVDNFQSSFVLTISDGLLLIASNLGNKKLHRFERMPADLSAEITSSVLPVCRAVVGDTVTYEFTVINNGPGTTDNTRVAFSLPGGDITLDTDTGFCTIAAIPFCTLGPLSDGQQVHITATIVLTMEINDLVVIKVEKSDIRDPNNGNNRARKRLKVDPLPPADLDLQLTDIEITQGIQNLANEVLLNTGKATFVRVYGQTNGATIRNAKAVLHGEDQVSGENLGTLNPIKAAQCVKLDGNLPNRDKLSGSFVFELPEPWWGGGLKLTAEINPDGSIPETNTANNTLVINRSFSKLSRICLITYPVRSIGLPLDGGGITFSLFPDRFAISSDRGNILSRALTLLPAREIRVYPQSHKLEKLSFLTTEFSPYEFTSEDHDDRAWINIKLFSRNTLTDDPDECDADGSRSHYIGMIHEGTIFGVGAGLAVKPGDEATVFLSTKGTGFDDPVGGRTLAHELGHNYDRDHVDCGGPKDPDEDYPEDRNRCNIAPDDPRSFYGFSFLNSTKPKVISPTSAGDLMSYRSNRWPSEYTWEAIQDVLCDSIDCFRPLSSVQAEATLLPPITGDVLVVSGQIDPLLGLQFSLRLPVEDVPKADKIYADQVASWPLIPIYTLELLDGTTVLHSEPFSPDVMSDQLTLQSSFGLVIPWDVATKRIELKENDVVIDSMDVSLSAPVVTSLAPNGGEVIEGEELTIEWAATDADGDDLLYTVLYSNNNGSSWHALVSGVGPLETLTVDASLLPGCNAQCLVKVIASDGLNTGSRQSAAGFTMPDRVPNSFIYFPDDGKTYSSGSSLTLRGAIYDPEDHYLPSEDLNWELSGIGLVGTGESIVLSDLADGEYTLTLLASDSGGQEGSLSITFNIGPLPEFDSNPAAGATLAFGDQPVQAESPPMLVQVENLGDADLTLACSLSGANPGSFLLKACPTPIAGTDLGDISISCQPSSLGAKTASLEVTTNDPDEPGPSYDLTCTGVEAPPEETIFADGFEG